MLAPAARVSLPWGAAAVLVWAFGLDAPIARAVYQPDSLFAWFFRQYGALVSGIIGWLALLWVLLPTTERRWPVVTQSALILALTMALGAGLLNQLVIKNMAERPRPRDIVLVESSLAVAEISGKSMPSGHAGIGFALAAPAFILRRKSKPLANAVLGGSLVWGACIGLARMMAGAHFFTDVLIAAAVSLGTAAGVAPWVERLTRITRWPLVLIMVIAAWGFVWFNRFTINLVYDGLQPVHHSNLPCPVILPQTNNPIYVTVTGYGAPVSQVRLDNIDGELTLHPWWGLYRNVECRQTELHTP